jgi:hypothetical protein
MLSILIAPQRHALAGGIETDNFPMADAVAYDHGRDPPPAIKPPLEKP